VPLPTVAIIGRPNVGKSTLMNRIVGRREAIVEERPGVTRDRKEVEAEWNGRRFVLVDTGGWLASGNSLDDKVSEQSERAMAEADAVLFVVDATTGVTEEDARAAEVVRRHPGRVLLVANKVDDTSRETLVWDLLSLGLGTPMAISALHGRGTGDLLDDLVTGFPAEDDLDDADDDLDADARGDGHGIPAVAIVGRPNVGKSTLFNRLTGEERAVVHDLPGTTRDTIDTVVETEDGPVRYVDTAGMRRRSKIDENTEYYSLVRALQAVDRSDIALLVIDSTIGVTAQDQRLAERIDVAGCPVIVILNKWELLDAEGRDDVKRQVTDRLHFIGDAPVLTLSALTGKNVHRLRPALVDTIAAYHRRVPTRKVNDVIRSAQARHPAPDGARVLYATQGASEPPTFTLFANRELPRTYLRYLENQLREAFDLGAVPLKLRVRRRSS
jgi:GTP-binding protein